MHRLSVSWSYCDSYDPFSEIEEGEKYYEEHVAPLEEIAYENFLSEFGWNRIAVDELLDSISRTGETAQAETIGKTQYRSMIVNGCLGRPTYLKSGELASFETSKISFESPSFFKLISGDGEKVPLKHVVPCTAAGLLFFFRGFLEVCMELEKTRSCYIHLFKVVRVTGSILTFPLMLLWLL